MTQQASPATGRLPDFIVIGAMKAATTALYRQLEQRPDIFMATPKEPNFFSMDKVYARGPDWYRSLFAGAAESQLCGEASPSYTRYPRFPLAAARMADLLPGVKLVYTMRHPVDRFYSNYVFDRSFGFKDTIRETLRDRPYVLETSRYINQIRRFEEYYPREQIHFVLLDDFEQDPRLELDRLADFLGVRPFTPEESTVGRANQAGRQHAISTGNQLLGWFRSLPLAGAAKQLIPPGARAGFRSVLTDWLPRSPLGRWLGRRHVRSSEPLTDELRAELHRRLDDSTRELAEHLGRDLSHWLAPAPSGEGARVAAAAALGAPSGMEA